jgi:hypothetical protein
MVMAMPGVTEGTRYGMRTWFVDRRGFAWERPLSKADIKRYGGEPHPPGPIMATLVEDLAEKEAVLAANPETFFTIPHFDGYAAVLIQLDRVTKKALREAIEDGWLACAPQPLIDEYLSSKKRR